jgi:hypothetical protein
MIVNIIACDLNMSFNMKNSSPAVWELVHVLMLTVAIFYQILAVPLHWSHKWDTWQFICLTGSPLLIFSWSSKMRLFQEFKCNILEKFAAPLREKWFCYSSKENVYECIIIQCWSMWSCKSLNIFINRHFWRNCSNERCGYWACCVCEWTDYFSFELPCS